MGKLVILKLDGDLENQGFRVTLQIGEETSLPEVDMTGYLPPATELALQIRNHWEEKYRPLGAPYRIKVGKINYDGSVKARKLTECKISAQNLSDRLNAWLETKEFREIDRKLRTKLNPDEELRLLIRTEDNKVLKLPWQNWNFIKDYSRAEVGLSSLKSQKIGLKPASTEKVRILAILGHREGIDIEADKQLLTESLPNAEIIFLVEPKREEINDKLWEKPWKIIFFAGHSETQADEGRIYINPQDYLTIDDLGYGLRKAVNLGLELAIFNSCDGLGLAKGNLDWQIPQMIVMRELVPDKVAQKFLRYFLPAFAGGKSFYGAVREARERLQGVEDEFPCATWLPTIWQNPGAIPPVWQDLYNIPEAQQKEKQPLWQSWVASLVVTSLVWGVRSLGLLQGWEINTYDQFMNFRPPESPDERILLVTITEEDVQSQPAAERAAASLSDRSLDLLLTKLEKSQATAIGLDIYRDNPAKYGNLATKMEQSDRLFNICFYGDYGVKAAPEIPGERQGFNNIFLDSDDILRRHLLAVESPEPCQSNYSFNFQLALRHLARVAPEIKLIPENSQSYIQLEDVVFKTLEKNTGGYHNLDNRGHQILINYRNTSQIAETVSLREFIEEYDIDAIGQRVVLIGTVAPSFNDHRWRTPMGKMTGLEVQAHLLSQILSTVLDHRPLIWTLPKAGELLWVFSWSVVGGIIAWRYYQERNLLIISGVAFIVLIGSCWSLLIFTGAWLPVVPSALALILTKTGVIWLIPEAKKMLKNHQVVESSATSQA